MSPSVDSIITSKRVLFVHLLFWMGFIGANFLIVLNVIDNRAFAVGFAFTAFVINVVLVYLHLLYLLPRYLFKRRFGQYLLLLVVMIVVATGLRILALEGVGDYARITSEPSLGYKIGVSLASSIIVLIITAPFVLLNDWLEPPEEEPQSGRSAPTESPRTHFFIKSDQKLVKIYFEEVTHVESLRDFNRIHTLSGRYLSQYTMRKMEELLPEDQFMRVHRTYIIALDRITAVSGNVVEIDDLRIPVGKTYREAFLARLALL